jgi:hypothetical protein
MLVTRPALTIADPRTVFEPAKGHVEGLRRCRIDLQEDDGAVA